MSGQTQPVPFLDALKVWARIGVMSFGGPAGQIALMHRVVVDERKWLSEQQFLNALNFCMLLPGPEAMQLATYSGWRLHGVRGGLAAGLLFVVPGALVVLGLAMIYGLYGKAPLVSAVFFGIKAAVLVIVIEALLRISRKALKRAFDWWVAGLAFVALFVFNAPFPLVIALAGLAGFWLVRAEQGSADMVPVTPVRWQRTLATVGLWLVIWFAPIAAVAALTFHDHVLVTVGLFFSKLAVVTFGGAYAVLAYMGQQAVETHNWLTAEEMIDGLGLAETTPGPLILVTEFVGYLAGFRASGLLGSISGGVAAAAMTLWATFAPCFLWVFAGAPYVERLQSMPRFSSALAGITAAVVGVILNLSIWFGLHVVFAEVERLEAGPVSMSWPVWSSVQWATLPLIGIAALALLRFHISVLTTLVICAGLGVALSLV
jgi:chromate transporter